MISNQDHENDSNSKTIEYTSLPLTERLWTVNDVALYLRLDPATVRAMARDGKLPAVKIGRVWRFMRASLEAYLFKEEILKT